MKQNLNIPDINLLYEEMNNRLYYKNINFDKK